MKTLLSILLLTLFFACGKKENANEAAPPADAQAKAVTPPNEGTLPENPPSPMPAAPRVFQKKLTDGKVSFDIKCQNGEQSAVLISSEGFEKRPFSTNFNVEGQMTDAHLLDLDNDGFCEIYLVFNETSDSGNMLLKGFASYRDKSAGEIYVKDTDMAREMNTDQVFVEDKKLKRSFKNDTGETVSFRYKLSKGESSFVLEPVKE